MNAFPSDFEHRTITVVFSATEHASPDNLASARADIADEAKNVENVPAIRLVDASLHGQPQQKQCDDRNEKQAAANPTLLHHVPSARNQPADCGSEH